MKEESLSDKLRLVQQCWLRARTLLGIKAVIPYEIKKGNRVIECIAFLPNFGSSRGMIIGHASPPHFATNSEVREYARENGIYISFINLDNYAEFNEESFKETLADWGFFGSATDRPDWLP